MDMSLTTPPSEGPVFDLGRCRCCALVTEECRLLNAAYDNSGQKEVYDDMMMECYGFTVSGLDGSLTARLVCAACVERLRAALAFRRQVLRVEDELRYLKVDAHAQEEECGPEQADGELELKVEVEEGGGWAEVPLVWPSDSATCCASLSKELQPDIRNSRPELENHETIAINNVETTIKCEDFSTEAGHLETDSKEKFEHNENTNTKNSTILPNTSSFNYHNHHGIFDTKPALIQYVETNNHSQHFECRLYPFRVVAGANLSHKILHDASKQHASDTCGFRFTTEHALIRHADSYSTNSGNKNSTLGTRKTGVSANGQPYRCEICDKVFTKKCNMERHIRMHNGKKPFSCTQCDYKCSQKSHLKNHIRTHTGERPFQCDTCGKRFTHKSNLIPHFRVHSGERPFSCTQCDYKSRVKRCLEQHIKIHTSEHTLHCEICHKGFTRKTSLIQHLRVHSKETPFSCTQCDYRSSLKRNLKIHMRTHTSGWPFHCETCDKGFTHKSNFIQHVRVHSRERPFCCTECDYRSSRKSGLNRHMITHLGDRPFQCEICHKRFSLKSNLIKHIRVHSREKSFSCTHCDYRSSKKKHLKSHMKTHTGEQT